MSQMVFYNLPLVKSSCCCSEGDAARLLLPPSGRISRIVAVQNRFPVLLTCAKSVMPCGFFHTVVMKITLWLTVFFRHCYGPAALPPWGRGGRHHPIPHPLHAVCAVVKRGARSPGGGRGRGAGSAGCSADGWAKGDAIRGCRIIRPMTFSLPSMGMFNRACTQLPPGQGECDGACRRTGVCCTACRCR